MTLTNNDLGKVYGGRAIIFMPIYSLFQKTSRLVFKFVKSFF